MRREGGLEQGNDALKSRSQENTLEGVKQEVGGPGAVGGRAERKYHCVGRVEKDSGIP